MAVIRTGSIVGGTTNVSTVCVYRNVYVHVLAPTDTSMAPHFVVKAGRAASACTGGATIAINAAAPTAQRENRVVLRRGFIEDRT
jgi:hypothetical protein